jgi:hypothetical protein
MQRRIKDALLAAFPDPSALNNILLVINRTYAQHQVNNASYSATVGAIVGEAASEGWLQALLDAAVQAVPADPNLRQIQLELRPYGAPAGVECYDVCRLNGAHLLVNRTELRQALRNLNNPHGKRILVVTGEPKCGKSHSAQLISYVAEVLGGFEFRHIDLKVIREMRDLDKRSDPVLPAELAARLVKKLSYQITLAEEPKDAQWARWVFTFCEDFEAVAMNDSKVHWLVIDEFNSVLLSQAALDLVKELARRINLTLPRFRLILLGFGEDLAGPVLGTVEKENVRRIDQRDLILFFTNAHVQMGLQYDPQKIADTVGRVLNKVDASTPEEYLDDLAPAVEEELGKLQTAQGH